jgi:hypothetical protein
LKYTYFSRFSRREIKEASERSREPDEIKDGGKGSGDEFAGIHG